jgi:four helix bundle protein
MRDYKNIKAYQLAEELVIEIYKKTKTFPKEELYGLISQLRRAMVSVPANIAEGASRNHKRD